MRPVLVEHGIVRWLVGQLSHLEAVPVSTLECCGALLMNLAQSQAGRCECKQVRESTVQDAAHDALICTVQKSMLSSHIVPVGNSRNRVAKYNVHMFRTKTSFMQRQPAAAGLLVCS